MICEVYYIKVHIDGLVQDSSISIIALHAGDIAVLH